MDQANNIYLLYVRLKINTTKLQISSLTSDWVTILYHTMEIFERILDSSIRHTVQLRINQVGVIKKCETTNVIYAVSHGKPL